MPTDDRQPKEWIERLKARDLRALSRLISYAENGNPVVYDVLAATHQALPKTPVVGLTGPPGAGKSTLLGQLIKLLRQKGQKVALIAVDPMSPFTGGALLGDRVRLSEHFNDPDVFIRSLSNRGRLGGLSAATHQVVHLAQLFGFDWIFVETVGVGQSEVDVRHIADLATLAIVPESGDGVQVLKAGVLEIADLFVINKSDRAGGEKLVSEIRALLEQAAKATDVIYSTTVQNEQTYKDLLVGMEAFFSKQIELIESRRSKRAKLIAHELVLQLVARKTDEWLNQSISSVDNPYEFFQEFMKQHPVDQLFK